MWWFSLKRKYLGIMCESKLGIVHAAFVYLSQVSLAYNSIALYQVSRLLVTPCTVLLKFVIQGEWLEGKRIIALIIIVVGCAMATISELNLQITLWGVWHCWVRYSSCSGSDMVCSMPTTVDCHAVCLKLDAFSRMLSFRMGDLVRGVAEFP